MVLKVPFDQFAQAVRKHTGGNEAYLDLSNGQILATAGNPERAFVVAATTALRKEESAEALKKAGLEVRDGRWTAGDDSDLGSSGDLHVAAIAYRSGSDMPGLWVDGFPEPVTGAQALRALYDEFVANGEIGDVSFEEFMRIAEANVVILPASGLESFAAAKMRECE